MSPKSSPPWRSRDGTSTGKARSLGFRPGPRENLEDGQIAHHMQRLLPEAELPDLEQVEALRLFLWTRFMRLLSRRSKALATSGLVCAGLA